MNVCVSADIEQNQMFERQTFPISNFLAIDDITKGESGTGYTGLAAMREQHC